MTLKTVLETMDGVDDAIKSLYTENDGKFILQIDGIDLHPDVATLKNAYERVKADKATALQERDAFKVKSESVPADFDADEWANRNEKREPDVEAQANLVRVRKELEAELNAAKSENTTIKTEYESKLNRFAMERDLGDALSTAGITDVELSKGAKALLSHMVKTDDGGKGVVETDMGPMALDDYVAKWAAGEGKAFVTPPSGGGRKGSENSTISNKWGDMTSSQKVALQRENPEEYERVKKAAG